MELWSEILSRKPERIRAMFQKLTTAEKVTVRAHLIRMAGEPDWHPEQIKSAKIAIEAIEDLSDI